VSSSTEGVFIEWTIDTGNTCNGTSIERRLPSGDYQEIGNISGICGSVSEPVDYEFLDNTPVPNVLVEYRLVLGNLGPSEPILFRYLDPSHGQFIILGLPSDDEIQLLPTATMSIPQQIVVYDSMGRSRLQETIDNQGLLLDLSAYPSGQYFITVLENGREVYATQFVHLAN